MLDVDNVNKKTKKLKTDVTSGLVLALVMSVYLAFLN